MRSSGFIKLIICMTVVALIYIHMQMRIFELAYQRESHEQRIKLLLEQKGESNYRILKLKSANYLGLKMLTDGSGMQFIDSDNIMQISTSKKLFGNNSNHSEETKKEKVNPLLSFMSMATQAEAEGQD